MNLTKTLRRFVCLGYIFQLKDLKLPDLEKAVEKWTVLSLSRTSLWL